MKTIIFDSGTLISFSIIGLLGKIKELKGIFDGKFIITSEVKKEVIDKPLTIKKFELEALNVKRLLEDGILEMPESIGINKKELDKKTEEVLSKANNTFFQKGKEIKIIQNAEASCIALSKILNEKGIENIIAVDERTLRMLGEKPENLEKLLNNKLHSKITSNRENFKFFREFKFIRSSELIYVAFKKGFFDLKDHDTVLDALLYAVKYNGCSISGEEIREILKLK